MSVTCKILRVSVCIDFAVGTDVTSVCTVYKIENKDYFWVLDKGVTCTRGTCFCEL